MKSTNPSSVLLGLISLGASPLFGSSPLTEEPKASTHQGCGSGRVNLERVTDSALNSRVDNFVSLLDLSKSSEGEAADHQDLETLMIRNGQGRCDN